MSETYLRGELLICVRDTLFFYGSTSRDRQIKAGELLTCTKDFDSNAGNYICVVHPTFGNGEVPHITGSREPYFRIVD